MQWSGHKPIPSLHLSLHFNYLINLMVIAQGGPHNVFLFLFFSFWKGKHAIDEPLFFPLWLLLNKAVVNIYGGHMWKFSRYIWKGAIAGVMLLVFRVSVVSYQEVPRPFPYGYDHFHSSPLPPTMDESFSCSISSPALRSNRLFSFCSCAVCSAISLMF